MDNFESIYETSKSELDKVKTEKTLLDDKISSLASELGFDESGDLQAQIEEKKAKLESDIASHEAEIKSLAEQIKAL